MTETKKENGYVNGVSESLFKVGLCLPSGPYVTDRDIEYIVGGITYDSQEDAHVRHRTEQISTEKGRPSIFKIRASF